MFKKGEKREKYLKLLGKNVKKFENILKRGR